MTNLWLKIKVWTKVALFALLFFYVVAFIIENNGKPTKFWYWISREADTSVLMLMFWAFTTGVVGTLLIQTTFKTIRQIRDIHERGQAERRKRRVEDMEDKAGRLNVKPEPAEKPDVEG
jgi:hypothetical protein